MNEIVKHINDTNASYRTPEAGDAKNTDLFLDNEHYELFKDAGEQITVRLSKENLSQAILFIASILPRKYDNSAMHKFVSYSPEFVYDQLAFLDYFFKEGGVSVNHKTQTWNARKDVQKRNGEIDNRFYFNGLLEEVEYVNSKGERITSKFTIRNYLAGGYSDVHIKKAEDKIYDIWITNVLKPYFDDKEDGLELPEKNSPINLPLQQIFYGAPGTGKSHKVKEVTETLPKSDVFRTTFHPDSDYSTFVGCYKPKMVKAPIRDSSGHEITSACEDEKKRIAYEYEPQAFLKAYVRAYETEDPVFLVIEEINRGNCAQIFGDMFQLLDRNGNGESDYAIKPETAIQEFLNEKLKDCEIEDEAIKSGEEMRLPANLHIWATMNTSDQSLFPIDSAFKRRWDWKYVPIDYDKEAWSIEVKGVRYSWSDFLRKMNDLVASTTDSEDKMLGFYFAKAKNGIIDADTFVGKVVFYLWNDVFKDYGLPKEILNGAESKEFAFRNFFMVDGHANEDMVRCLLGNLKVKSFDDYYGSVQKNHLEEDNDPNEFLNNEGVISKFTYNGQPTKYLYEIPYKVVQDYVDAHSEMSAQQVHDYFNSKFDIPNCGISHFIETEKEYHNRDGQKYQEKSAKPLTMHNGETIYVSAIWRAKEQNDNFFNFIKIAKENNWGTIKRQEQAN